MPRPVPAAAGAPHARTLHAPVLQDHPHPADITRIRTVRAGGTVY